MQGKIASFGPSLEVDLSTLLGFETLPGRCQQEKYFEVILRADLVALSKLDQQKFTYIFSLGWVHTDCLQ